SGVVWHRVLVGPFANTSKMASARAKLAQNEIDSLLLKRSL
ncbi:MAG: carbamoyl-phosphate synthase small subunit, partial [Porticoccaceae bacterium]|nr:carbamoyl-phosphate synthase small subunit [Porticoccaceae bacterium]